MKISRFAHPDILLTGIARHVQEAVLLKDVINETGAIHAAAFWIGRAIGVTEILFCQREAGVEDLANFCWIGFVPLDLVWRKTHVRPTFRSHWRSSWSFFGFGCWRRTC